MNCYLAALLANEQVPDISDFAANGLDSANSSCAGLPCFLGGTGNAAFPGRQKLLGTNQMLFPIGKSLYKGLQMSFKENVKNPFRGVRAMNLQVSYALSKYIATSQDSDFISTVEDTNRPTAFTGPNGLDRKHQISFGGTLELPAHFRMSVISHFYSPLPLSLRLPSSGLPGGLFQTDWTGDGTGDGTAISNGGEGDLLPGTKLGSYGRTLTASTIAKAIQNYNSTFAGSLTPAGQVLVTQGFFTKDQLAVLNGVMPQLAPVPQGQVGLAWLRALDLRVGWSWKFRERITLEPTVAFFNVLNFSNFDGSPVNTLSGTLDGSSGSANGTTVADRRTGGTRVGFGSGVFGLGSPRAMEFGLRLTF